MSGNPWTKEEEDLCKKLLLEGKKYKEIENIVKTHNYNSIKGKNANYWRINIIDWNNKEDIRKILEETRDYEYVAKKFNLLIETIRTYNTRYWKIPIGYHNVMLKCNECIPEVKYYSLIEAESITKVGHTTIKTWAERGCIDIPKGHYKDYEKEYYLIDDNIINEIIKFKEKRQKEIEEYRSKMYFICKNCQKKVYHKKYLYQMFCNNDCANEYKKKYLNQDVNIFENGFDSVNTYILGFIYADGCLHLDKKYNGEKMSIGCCDKEFMESLRKLITPNKKLYENDDGNDKHRTYYSVITSNIHIIKFIKDAGITYRKSLTKKFPECIPKEYLNHFIRGYFDGNGSITIEPKYGYHYVKFTTGSKKFVEGIYKVLKQNKIHTGKIYKDNRHTAYYLQISSQIDIFKFYNYIYKNAEIYLDRKYEKHLTFYSEFIDWSDNNKIQQLP